MEAVKEQWVETTKINNVSRYREIISKIINYKPNITSISNWNDEGDIEFRINMIDLGLTYNEYNKYKNEIFSYFVTDFIGELIIRENINLFVEKMKCCDINDYMTAVETYGDHQRFGISTNKGTLVFKFNISLLKNILTEDMREKLG